MDFVTNNIALILGALIVVIGLFVFGMRDLSRFSFKRAWAISGVCFDESIRRRILWVTPLAIVGVIVVAQLTRPFDEQDAIRQTAKFCLFATGMLVAMVSIILAATNLPKEIENRVIFTVVTKPTTRLEIVFGKVLGFARVSAAILLIMGGFTWAYLGVRAWSLQKSIHASLETGNVTAAARHTLEHYAEYGLLTAKTYQWGDSVQIFARPPEGEKRWFSGGHEGSVFIPFTYPAEKYIAPGQQSLADGTHLVVVANLDYEQESDLPATNLLRQMGIDIPGAAPDAPRATPELAPAARVTIQILNTNEETIGPFSQMDPPDPRGIPIPRGGGEIVFPIHPEIAARLATLGGFIIEITGATAGTQYALVDAQQPSESPVKLQVVGVQSGQSHELEPTVAQGAPPVQFRGRRGTFGQQLSGNPDDAPIGVYRFTQATPELIQDGRVPFEMRVGIERSGADLNIEDDDFTQLEMRIVNYETGAVSDPTIVRVESNRNTFFEVPAELMAGGNFDLYIRNLTPGHWVGLLDQSVQMVTADQPFAWNLLKSLLILWLMSVLVVTVAIFCSIWLSWPIAIILSVVILLGHWGVSQIGDVGNELGRQVAQEMFPTGAPQARVVSTSVNVMTVGVQMVGSVLPDISKFAATEDLERGVSIPRQRLGSAAAVALGFGFPLMVLAYVILRNKEVAP